MSPARPARSPRRWLLPVVLSLMLGGGGYLAWCWTGDATPASEGVAGVDEPEGDARLNAALRSIEATLARFPPTADPPLERLSALRRLDRILRQEDIDEHPAVQRFFYRRIEQAEADMRTTRVEAGALVWKMYNHGFVVRTNSVTVCFDLVRAQYLPGFAMSRELMRAIVAACDVLFVSHVDIDHAESFVAQTFVDQGKPVVAPRQVTYREPLNSRITRLERDPDRTHELAVRHGQVTLRVVVFPGRQGGRIDNNVTLVTTPEGISVAHTGDQWDRSSDGEWIRHVRKHHRTDILLPNDWTYDIVRMVRGFDPAVVIPGHENELGHPVHKRQPHLFSLDRKTGSDRFGGSKRVGYTHPLVIMAWGERFHYHRSQTNGVR